MNTGIHRTLTEEVKPLSRIEVFTLNQVAQFKSRGFELRHNPESGRTFMVLTNPPVLAVNNSDLPMLLRRQAE